MSVAPMGCKDVMIWLRVKPQKIWISHRLCTWRLHHHRLRHRHHTCLTRFNWLNFPSYRCYLSETPSVLFCFVLFCFVFVLFCFVLFCFVFVLFFFFVCLFCFVLFFWGGVLALKWYQSEAHISYGFKNTSYYVTLDTERCNTTTHISRRAHDAWPQGRKWLFFWQNWVFDEISKYGFIRTFCNIFESYNPSNFRNKNGVKIVVNAENIYHWRCIMQEGHKYHLRHSCINLWIFCFHKTRPRKHIVSSLSSIYKLICALS